MDKDSNFNQQTSKPMFQIIEIKHLSIKNHMQQDNLRTH